MLPARSTTTLGDVSGITDFFRVERPTPHHPAAPRRSSPAGGSRSLALARALALPRPMPLGFGGSLQPPLPPLSPGPAEGRTKVSAVAECKTDVVARKLQEHFCIALNSTSRGTASGSGLREKRGGESGRPLSLSVMQGVMDKFSRRCCAATLPPARASLRLSWRLSAFRPHWRGPPRGLGPGRLRPATRSAASAGGERNSASSLSFYRTKSEKG